MASNDSNNCIVCGVAALVDARSTPLPGVTSDTKPYASSGQLAACDVCGHVQRRQTAEWFAAIDRIYAEYDVYRLSGGAEQLVFQAGGASPRSRVLVRRLASEIGLPDKGTLLDVGCGKGAFLSAFSAEMPGWTLAGSELDDRSQETVLAIPGVNRFYIGDLAAITEKFDVISLMHVLEHIPQPVEFLAQLAEKLTPRGVLFAQVPFYVDNPFDLLVMDHASHFTPTTMARAGERAGMTVVRATADWVRKEVSLVLSKTPVSATRTGTDEKQPSDRQPNDRQPNDKVRMVFSFLNWLREVREDAETIARDRPMYVFGTSTAGTWLVGAMQQRPAGFVDEDCARQRNTHLGLKVFDCAQLPVGSSVYIALPYPMANDVATRLRATYPRLELIMPPPMFASIQQHRHQVHGPFTVPRVTGADPYTLSKTS